MYQIFNYTAPLLSLAAIVYMTKERRRVSKGQVVQDSLVLKEKIIIWILCLVDPVIAGAIFYYGWKKRLPVKAKQANRISWLVFSIAVIIIVILFRIGVPG